MVYYGCNHQLWCFTMEAMWYSILLLLLLSWGIISIIVVVLNIFIFLECMCAWERERSLISIVCIIHDYRLLKHVKSWRELHTSNQCKLQCISSTTSCIASPGTNIMSLCTFVILMIILEINDYKTHDRQVGKKNRAGLLCALVASWNIL